MSKNIIMQQKTADGYEELYPKADGDSSVIVNNTTNQFLGGGSTVGDALEYLSKFGMYWWKKVYQKANYSINETTDGLTSYNTYYYSLPQIIYPNWPSSAPNTYFTYPVSCSSSISLSEDGVLSLGNSIQGIRCKWENNKNDGYIYSCTTVNNLPFYFIMDDVVYKGSDSVGYLNCNLAQKTYNTEYYLLWRKGYIVKCVPYISSYTTTTTYICSSDPNAYPDQGNTDSSGAKYWKVGQPWEFLPKLGKVETGYYTGTGSGNVTLTFENAPQFVFIQKKTTTGQRYVLEWCKDASVGIVAHSSGNTDISVVQSGNNFTPQSSYMNDSSVAYQYFAITQ